MAKSLKQTLKFCMIRFTLYLLKWSHHIKYLLGKLTYKFGIYGQYEYDGVSFCEIIHPIARMKACINYDNFRPDDVFLLTYPKSGTHFAGAVVHSIQKQKGLLPEGHTAAYKTYELIVPFSKKSPDSEPLADMEAAMSPRVLGSHLPWTFLPQKVKDGKIKVIHCIRNPKDVASSLFPFLSKASVLESDWSSYVDNYVAGNLIYGGYFDFMKQWYPHRNQSNLLNIYFEDMVIDLAGSIRKIASFLNIDLSDEQVQAVADVNTFASKKDKHPFMYRKGKIGSWKADFTVEQNEMTDEWIRKEGAGLDDLKLIYE